MDNIYGSCQTEKGPLNTVSTKMNGTEDVALLRKNNETTPSASMSTRKSKGIQTSILVGMALWLAVMAVELSPFLFMVSTRHHQSDESDESDDAASAEGVDKNAHNNDENDDDALHALWGSTAYLGVFNIRQCSLDQCISSPCRDAPSAPFVCLALKHNPSVRGGCGSMPWTRETCSDQCDVTGCTRLLAKYNAKPKTKRNANTKPKDCDVECPKHWCHRNHLCGDNSAPYQCTAGGSMYGCSSDKFEWTLRSTETECSSCCKTSSCDN